VGPLLHKRRTIASWAPEPQHLDNDGVNRNTLQLSGIQDLTVRTLGEQHYLCLVALVSQLLRPMT